MRSKKRILKKRLRIFLGVLIISLFTIVLYNYFKYNNKVSNLEKNGSTEKVKKEILNEYVKTDDKIYLYYKKLDSYEKFGEIGKDVVLHLTYVGKDYYKLIGLDEDYYVKSDNLSNYNEKIVANDRYKKYIVFNKNIKTDNITNFYDDKDNLVYSIYKGINLPIVIMDDKKVGVVYNNGLLYIKRNNGAKIIDSNNTNDKNIEGIGVLNYHFFYDDSIEDVSKCNQGICMSITKLKEQLDYIKENNYFTPTMEEFEMYIDGKIRLPKSVVITIDDGWRAMEGIDVINAYKLNATIFVITGSYNANDFKREYIEIHSHSENMHEAGVCSEGQGGGIQCLPEEKILDDLKKSSEKLEGSKIFCYPFYEYNDYSISMLKKAGYTMAFAGEKKGSYNMTSVGADKYRISRFVMMNYTTMDDLSRYLEGKYYS